MKTSRHAIPVLAALPCAIALAVAPAVANAQSFTFSPVDIHFEVVTPGLPTLLQISQITLRGVEYRNTSDNDTSGTPSIGDTAIIDGVFAVTGFASGGSIVFVPGLNTTFEVTATYRSLRDHVIGTNPATGSVDYATDAETGVLTLYVGTDMTKKHNFDTGNGFADGPMVAQFAVSPENPESRGGVYRIIAPFNGARDFNLIRQNSLAGFFVPLINGAQFDANLDTDPDNDGVGGNVPQPTNWPFPTATPSVNFPMQFFAQVDGSQIQGDLAIPGVCRMTGGSVDVNGNILLGPQENGAGSANDRYQTGGQIGAPTVAPDPYGEWTHHQQPGGTTDKWTFHSGTASAPVGTKILSVQCSEPGYCQPARPAPFKRIAWDGIGSFKTAVTDGTMLAACPTISKSSLHYYRAMVEDIGEPGAGGSVLKKKTCNHVIGTPISATDCKSCPDTYQIEIHCTTNPASPVIYTVGGFIDGGNFQIHPPVGESQPATTTKGGKK